MKGYAGASEKQTTELQIEGSLALQRLRHLRQCKNLPLDFPQGITVVQDTSHRHCSHSTQGCNLVCHPGQASHSVIWSRLLQRQEITLDVIQATVYAVNDTQQYSYKHIKTNTMADTYTVLR